MPDTQPSINACDRPPTHWATSGEPETPLWGMPPTPRGCRGRGGWGTREGGHRRSCLLNLCPIDSVYKQWWGRWGTVTLWTVDPPETPSRGPRGPPASVWKEPDRPHPLLRLQALQPLLKHLEGPAFWP